MTDMTARLARAQTAYQAAHAAGRARKMRQARTRINACIRALSLGEYLAFLNSDRAGFGLTEDAAHWAQIKVVTAFDLARYLDACDARARQKDALDWGDDEDDDGAADYDDGQPDEAQEWHDYDPDC